MRHFVAGQLAAIGGEGDEGIAEDVWINRQEVLHQGVFNSVGRKAEPVKPVLRLLRKHHPPVPAIGVLDGGHGAESPVRVVEDCNVLFQHLAKAVVLIHVNKSIITRIYGENQHIVVIQVFMEKVIPAWMPGHGRKKNGSVQWQGRLGNRSW